MAENQDKIRGIIILLFIGLVSIIFLIKIFYWQTPAQRKKALWEISLQNIRTITLKPDRGFIFDRNGKVLAANKVVYELYAIPAHLSDSFPVNYLANILNLDTQKLQQKILPLIKTNVMPFKPRLIEKFIAPENAALYFEKQYLFQGTYLVKSSIRYYPAHSAAHAIGYLTEVNEQDLKQDKYYRLGDYIGRTGLEAYYEKYLRGKKGVERWLVTSTGKVVGRYLNGKTDTLPQAGLPLTSTIDLELQKYAEFLMKDKPGAIVAIEPKTGEILAFVSSPYYDPNLLTGKDLSKNFRKLLMDTIFTPLFNRAIQSDKNPPGSTFKVVQAIVAQQLGVINTHTTFSCPGGFFYKGVSIKCHIHNPVVNFYYSIQTSCNTYYSHVYRLIMYNPRYNNQHQAYQAWYEYVRQFGVGKELGIDIPGEEPGSLPDTTVLNIAFRRKDWGFLQVVHMGIGQGRVGITPLQLANIAATIANRGFYITPHLAKKIGDSTLYFDTHYVAIDTQYFANVIDAMELVFEPGGTAAFSKIPGIRACGKTGTAQNPKPTGKDDNSIFIAFAPKYNPKIALAVYVEEGGPGSQTAAPIASLLIQKYLLDTIITPYIYEARVKDKNIMEKILKREYAKANIIH